MLKKIKKAVIDFQLNSFYARAYQKRVFELSEPYQMWIKENEKKTQIKALGFLSVSLHEFVSGLTAAKDEYFNRWYCVKLTDGKLSLSQSIVSQFFINNDTYGLYYADEDTIERVGDKRINPWFKPSAYSPDTMRSYFYFGSYLFINGSVVKKLLAEQPKLIHEIVVFCAGHCHEEYFERAFLYYFIFAYVDYMQKHDIVIGHIDKVLFHAYQTAFWGFEDQFLVVKEAVTEKYFPNIYAEDDKRQPFVSIVIPSKDNVAVLAACLESLITKTQYDNYQIILVDNGSTEENIVAISSLFEKYSDIDIQYLYEIEEFNYSKMCNKGLARAEGELVLLLNDDIEIIQEDWLQQMVLQVGFSHVGAVGAKLLYPQSDRIQHVGVYNKALTPEHMLLGALDTEDIYFGKNRYRHDVIGVTGACLLVKKSLLDEIGGLDEQLTVSYNDVDLCYKLHEMGYYNVVCNDVVLYHHESLSRGADIKSRAKWDRQMKERELLYTKHPQLLGNDPYGNPNFAGFKNRFLCNYLYDYEKRTLFSIVKKYKADDFEKWYNNTLQVQIEEISIEHPIDKNTEKECIRISGWSYVSSMDGARYKRYLLLEDSFGEKLKVEVFDQYRKDVASTFSDEKNIELSGFECRILSQVLPARRYKLSMVYKDSCTRQLLVKKCDKDLEVFHG